MKTSWIGHVFDPNQPESLPSPARKLSRPELEAWCERETERYRVVAVCPVCERKLIAGEQIPHRLKHASCGRVRSAAGTVLQLPPELARKAYQLIGELLEEVR